MATNYPDGVDDFEEPPNPEEVPLAQAGGQPNRTTANPGRNHVEHHRDLGDAVGALQTHAARIVHDHSGSATDTSRGSRLSSSNTHQQGAPPATLSAARALADTDSSQFALHHTLGPGANQAAAGDHSHDYDGGGITNRPIVRRASGDLPDQPYAGLMVYETDTGRVRAWGDLGNGPRWNLLPAGAVPVVRLEAGKQNVPAGSGGATLSWDKVEDNFGCLPGQSGTTITLPEPGLYHVDVALQWNVQWVPEWATVVLCLDGQETTVRSSSFQRGGILANVVQGLNPDFSQTMSLSGKIRTQSAGQDLTVVCRQRSTTLIAALVSLFDPESNVVSRLELCYVGP